MSCYNWLDVGMFLDEAFGFPVSHFLGKPLNAFFFLPFPSFLFSSCVFFIFVLPPSYELKTPCFFLLRYDFFFFFFLPDFPLF